MFDASNSLSVTGILRLWWEIPIPNHRLFGLPIWAWGRIGKLMLGIGAIGSVLELLGVEFAESRFRSASVASKLGLARAVTQTVASIRPVLISGAMVACLCGFIYLLSCIGRFFPIPADARSGSQFIQSEIDKGRFLQSLFPYFKYVIYGYIGLWFLLVVAIFVCPIVRGVEYVVMRIVHLILVRPRLNFTSRLTIALLLITGLALDFLAS